MTGTVSSTLALLVTAGVAIVSVVIPSLMAAQRQRREQEEARRREEHHHLRALCEDGSAALRSAFRALKPDVIPRPTVEQVEHAIGDVMAVSDRLALYLPDDHPVPGAYTRTTAALHGLIDASSAVPPAGAGADGITDADRAFLVSLDAYNDACRALLRM